MCLILRQIKDQKLYKETHRSWAAWLRSAHQDPAWGLPFKDTKTAALWIEFPEIYAALQAGCDKRVPLPTRPEQIKLGNFDLTSYKLEVVAAKWTQWHDNLPRRWCSQ